MYILYCLSNNHDTHTHPDLPDLPLSNARNVASYTLFLTYMDSRSSRAMVVICPLVLLIFSQLAGSDSLEYLHTHAHTRTHRHTQRHTPTETDRETDTSLNPNVSVTNISRTLTAGCYLNSSSPESFICWFKVPIIKLNVHYHNKQYQPSTFEVLQWHRERNICSPSLS